MPTVRCTDRGRASLAVPCPWVGCHQPGCRADHFLETWAVWPPILLACLSRGAPGWAHPCQLWTVRHRRRLLQWCRLLQTPLRAGMHPGERSLNEWECFSCNFWRNGTLYVHVYVFIRILSVPLSLGRDGMWEEYFSLNIRGKHVNMSKLPSWKAAVTMEMTATSSLVFGTVGFRKTHRVAVTLGVKNKLSAT